MQKDIPTAIKNVLALQDLKPSIHVNNVMTALVNSVISDSKTDLSSINRSTQLNIRNVSSAAETEMEKFWARLVISSDNPQQILQTFPYISNYAELTERELKLVKESGLFLNGSHNALVVGSGPLPLSAFEIHRQSGALVDHVDSSLEAITLCKNISKAIGITSEHYHAMGHKVVLDKQYDLILIAALAGASDEAKQQIINNILPSLRKGGRIIIRSAKGNRTLLYPPIKADGLKDIRLLKEYHPTDHIINSVLIYERA
jgi:nicotianamine synthase